MLLRLADERDWPQGFLSLCVAQMPPLPRLPVRKHCQIECVQAVAMVPAAANDWPNSTPKSPIGRAVQRLHIKRQGSSEWLAGRCCPCVPAISLFMPGFAQIASGVSRPG